MLPLCGILVSFVAVQCIELDCKNRLDVIDQSAWSGLPTLYQGRDLRNETSLIASGYVDRATHSVIHTVDKRTYLRGSSSHLHLYGGDMTRELIEIQGKRVRDIQFGTDFIAILTEEGELWTAGKNSYGQLGHHGTTNRPILSPVHGLPAVKMMAVGFHHCVVLTREGNLMSWGLNDNKQLGCHTSSSDINPTPQNISLGQETAPTKYICCRFKQCAAFTENLEVFTWGYSEYIGRPSGDTSPGMVHGIPANQTITKVTCGAGHTLALTQTGDLYGWGYNNYGEQVGAPKETPYASKLNLGERIVRDVEAGYHITVIRTYSSVGEYFGRYDGTDHRTPQLASNVEYSRDVMARSYHGQQSMGTVHVGCQTSTD